MCVVHTFYIVLYQRPIHYSSVGQEVSRDMGCLNFSLLSPVPALLWVEGAS